MPALQSARSRRTSSSSRRGANAPLPRSFGGCAGGPAVSYSRSFFSRRFSSRSIASRMKAAGAFRFPSCCAGGVLSGLRPSLQPQLQHDCRTLRMSTRLSGGTRGISAYEIHSGLWRWNSCRHTAEPQRHRSAGRRNAGRQIQDGTASRLPFPSLQPPAYRVSNPRDAILIPARLIHALCHLHAQRERDPNRVFFFSSHDLFFVHTILTTTGIYRTHEISARG